MADDQPVENSGELAGAGSNVSTGFVFGETFGYKPVQYSELDGLAVFEGDIVLGSVEEMEQVTEEVRAGVERAVILSGAQFRWPNGTIAFTIDPTLPSQERVTEAIEHIQQRTNLRLVPRTSERNFVTFRPGSGCSSQVGMRGNEQFITLAEGCDRGSTIHEICHAAGVWHEQSREDRDRFVRILWQNIQAGMEHNFNQHITDGDDVGNYDFGSIMHYPRWAFSRNGQDTIQPLGDQEIGQRQGLSDGDVAAINLMYPRSGWSAYHRLGGVLTSDPAVARNRDGRLEVFVRGTDNALYNIWQTAANNGWSGFGGLGGVLTTEPSVISNLDGRLEVFVRGTDNALWHIWQTAASNGWSGWHSLGGKLTSNIALAQNADGRLEAFARGTDNALWHIWQTSKGGNWSNWSSMGGVITSDPIITRNKDGRLEVFGRGTDLALWHIWQTSASNGWSNWASMGGVLTSQIAVDQNADGRLEVFVRGTDNALWHIWQTAASNGWSNWASMGGVLTSDPAVARNRDGRLEVFVRGTDNALWHIWQTSASNGWSGWDSLGGILTSNIGVGQNADGRLEAFVRGTDNALWHIWQQ
jgi:acylphosphatase